MVLLDTSVLAYLLYPDAPAPKDPATGHAVVGCKERLEHFIKRHQKTKILVATPTFAEFLVKAQLRWLLLMRRALSNVQCLSRRLGKRVTKREGALIHGKRSSLIVRFFP
jgi:hypothetical protein